MPHLNKVAFTQQIRRFFPRHSARATGMNTLNLASNNRWIITFGSREGFIATDVDTGRRERCKGLDNGLEEGLGRWRLG